MLMMMMMVGGWGRCLCRTQHGGRVPDVARRRSVRLGQQEDMHDAGRGSAATGQQEH